MLIKRNTFDLKNLYLRSKVFVMTHSALFVALLVVGICILQSVMMVADTSLGESVTNVSNNALDELNRVYCGSVFYLVLVLGAAGFLLLKNDKAKAACGIAAIGSIVFFVIIKVAAARSGGAIGKTMEEVTEWAQ